MILLVGLTNDPIIHYFYRQIKQTKLPIAFIDQQQLGGKIMLDHEMIYATDNSWSIEHASVQAVFNRLVGSPKQMVKAHETQLELLQYHLDYVYPNVLNRPMSNLSNYSKPMQLSMLELKQINIPSSEIRVGCFPPTTPEMIFKSISAVRSIVRPLTKLDTVIREPVLFQRRCCGYNVRVHCLGDSYQATKIETDVIDYRYGQAKLQANYQLPETIASECSHITEKLGLTFAGIDLINFNENWTILEVNTAPGYSYFEQQDPQKSISKMLINHFSRIAYAA